MPGKPQQRLWMEPDDVAAASPHWPPYQPSEGNNMSTSPGSSADIDVHELCEALVRELRVIDGD